MNTERNMKVAITGGIGSGKSYVCQLLQQQGIEIYDCDKAAKELMNNDQTLRKQLISLIGEQAYIGKKLNKTVVASFLLASPENTKALNAMVHPAVADHFVRSGYQWMECAILFESGFDRLVDRVVAVTAPRHVRVERIMKRDQITAEKAEEWIEKQWPQEKVEQMSHYTICNDGQQPLDIQLKRLLQQLKMDKIQWEQKKEE